jgi:parallel beta-helix repeat protein
MDRHSLAITAPLALLALAGAALAGPLNPPAGPVTSTYKTLTEVEPRTPISSLPFTITQPGSYYLTANLTGTSGQNGINVNTSGVTIDLGGFTLTGVPGSLNGISIPSGSTTVVRNGSVAAWGANGVLSYYRPGCRIENITASGNGAVGIYAGSRTTVSGCVAESNGIGGISVNFDSVVSGCIGSGSTAGSGIEAYHGCTITGCSASNNSGPGLHVSDACTIVNCTARSNGGSGIGAGDDCNIQGCTADANSADGIHAGQSCTLRGNICTNSGDDGIQIDSQSLIVGNSCSFNGAGASGGGVYITGSSNRVEDNHCLNNRYGVLASGAATSNVIVKNTAQGNAGGNFSVTGLNSLAPVVTNPGSNGFATASPWSNFAY